LDIMNAVGNKEVLIDDVEKAVDGSLYLYIPFIQVYGAYLLSRGIEGIGEYYGNLELMNDARFLYRFGFQGLFIVYIVVAAIYAIINLVRLPQVLLNYYQVSGIIWLIWLMLFGYGMRRATRDLYRLTNIVSFDIAEDEWKWTVYLPIIGWLAYLFAAYNTYKGFKEMLYSLSKYSFIYDKFTYSP